MKTIVKKLTLALSLCLTGAAFAQDKAADADCACMEFPGMKVVIDECKMEHGYCVGSCQWQSVDNPNVVVASGRLCDKTAGAKTDQKVSFYSVNSNLDVNIGKPVTLSDAISVPLDLSGAAGTMIKYDIVNSFGEVVATKYILAAGSSNLEIKTNDLAHGVYALKFEVNGEVINKTFSL